MERTTIRNGKSIQNPIFMGLFILGVIILRVFYISRTTGPFIYADEFGYWSHAAHMTGHTWAGVMDGMGWYSFGYSFWLALTFLVSDHMAVMYRAAILLNVLMSVMCHMYLYFGILYCQQNFKEEGWCCMWSHCVCGSLFSHIYLLHLHNIGRDVGFFDHMASVL